MRVLLLAVLFFACGDSSSDDNKSPNTSEEESESAEDDENAYDHSVAVGELTDTRLETIKAFMIAKSYETWTATAVHDPSGNSPHGKVKTYFNDALKKSLEDNNPTHPVGSITMKELFENDGTTIKGYAADIKIRDGEGAETWLFYEGFGPDFDNFYGIADSTCVGCHSTGKDYVREPLP